MGPTHRAAAMPLTAARAVAVVLVTYAVSSAVFVDGLPAPSEEDGAIALLAAEEGTGAGFANFGEGLTGADGIDPNMVDIGKVFAHHRGADARAPRASRRGNPLQRFASGEMVKIVRRAANVKVKMAREKEHKAQAQVVEMQKSMKQSEAATAKAKASAAAAQQKAEQSALDAKKFHDEASAIALKQAAVEHAPARSLPAKKLRMLAATKREQGVEPELTANKLASTSTRISTLLRHEAAQKSAERKAQNVAADAKEGRDKALEKATLPRLQGAAVVPTTFKSDGSAPPADGITEATAVANPEMKRQDRAAAEAEEEIRADELGEARPVTKRLRKATKLPKGTGPGQTKEQQSRKPVSCFRAGKCDPEACLCKLGQDPVPWVQLRKQNMAHSERKKGDASCTKAGTDECDPEACLCRQDGNHVPLSKAKVTTAGKKGDASCIKAGTDECDPEACLCRHGQPPVLRHTLHKKQHPRLGAEGPSGHVDPNLKKGYYERMPNLQGHKPVLPEAEQFADQAVEKFVHWDHPDKFQKQEQKQAEGAIATEHKIYNKLKQMGDAHDAARKLEKAGIAEFK